MLRAWLRRLRLRRADDAGAAHADGRRSSTSWSSTTTRRSAWRWRRPRRPRRHVVEAASGREALRCLLQQEFAVILLDVNMPGLDGFETAALIRERRSSAHTPIIFVTAYSDDTHAARGYSLGAVDYILSPGAARRAAHQGVGVHRPLPQDGTGHPPARGAAPLRRATAPAQPRLAGDPLGALDRRDARSGRRQRRRRSSARTRRRSSRRRSPDGASRDGLDVSRRRGRRRRAPPPIGTPGRRRCRAARAAPLERGRAAARSAAGAAPPSWLPAAAARLAGGAADRARRPHHSASCSSPKSATAISPREDEGILVQLAQMAAIAIENTIAAEAREANRLKDEFLGVLSHELRTPLQAMLTWISILRSDAGGKPGLMARGLDVIERSARTQMQLIADLLDVSRIIRGQLRLEIGPLTCVSVVELALESLKPAAAAKHIAVDWTPPQRRVPHRGRRGAPAADRLESGLQRDQVHPRGGRVERARCASTGRGDAYRARYRRRHPARLPAARLRALPPGRQQHRPRSTAASASAWRSSAIWSSCTAAPCAAENMRRGRRLLHRAPAAAPTAAPGRLGGAWMPAEATARGAQATGCGSTASASCWSRTSPMRASRCTAALQALRGPGGGGRLGRGRAARARASACRRAAVRHRHARPGRLRV